MNVFDYLATNVKKEDLDRLYENPWTCQAIFRSLPPLAKQYVMRLLCVAVAVPKGTMDAWAKAPAASQTAHKTALARLDALRVLLKANKEKALPGGGTKTIIVYRLNPTFQKQLKVALCTLSPGPWSRRVAADKHRPSIAHLDEYAQTQWESVLHFMVNSSAARRSRPSPAVIDLLVRTNLMQRGYDGAYKITNEGFQFLLKDIYTQVWTFILQYVSSAEERKMSRDELLMFLFQLSFLTLGQDNAVEELTGTQQLFVQHLKELGLIYQRKANSTRFYPTRLAINLSSGMSRGMDPAALSASAEGTGSGLVSMAGAGAAQHGQGYIVVETNYRIYAYTASELQIHLLALFVKMLYRLPNLAVGVITRESIRAALVNGITASQMIEFLQEHAHPITSEVSRLPGKFEDGRGIMQVPETVADQIRLWESERNRITVAPAVLYDQFPSLQVFRATEAYAKERRWLLWSDATPGVLRMVVTASSPDDLRAFIKKKTASP